MTLQLRNPSDAIILRRIMTQRRDYYNTFAMPFVNNTLQADLPEDVKEIGVKFENEEQYSVITKANQSKAYAFMVDCFGKLGGYKKIRSVIAELEPKGTEMLFIKRLIKTVANTIDYLKKEQWETYVLPIAKLALEFFAKLPDSELKLPKEKDIMVINRFLHKLFKSPLDENKQSLVPCVEEVELNLAMRLFGLPTLERRIAGMKILTGKLSNLKHKWPSENPEHNQAARNLAEWLQGKNMSEQLFGENVHGETVRRAGELLSFMYAWRMLPGLKITEFWESVMNKHEAIQAATLNALEKIVLHFTRKDAGIMLEYLKRIPMAKFTENMMGLLQALAKNEYFRNKKKSPQPKPKEEHRLRGGTVYGVDKTQVDTKKSKDDFDRKNYPDKKMKRSGSGNDLGKVEDGSLEPFEIDPFIPDEVPIDPTEPLETFEVMDTIWEFLQEDAANLGLNLSVQTKLTDTFMSLLNRYFLKKSQDYILKCEELISINKSPILSAKLFIRISEAMSKNKNTQVNIKDPSFLQKVILFLIKFKINSTQMALHLQQVQGEKKDADIFEQLVTNETLKLYYYAELETRLNLLRFLVVKGKQKITKENIGILWQIFLLNNISTREITSFFGFMHALVESDQGVSLVIEGAFDSFLEEILLKMHPKEYCQSAFNCLKYIVIALNSHYRRIKVLQNNTFEIVDMQLFGVRVIWQIALEAKDENVQKSAANFLHDIYKRISPELAEKSGKEVRKDFLVQCMNHIKTGISEKNTLRIIRVLHLLCRYIKELENNVAAAGAMRVPVYEICVSISLNKTNTSISTTTSNTVREMLESVKKVLELPEPLEDLIFFTKGSNLKPSNDTLYESGIRDNIKICVSKACNDEFTKSQAINLKDCQQSTQSTQDLSEAVAQLSQIFPYQVSLLQAALKKAKNDVNQASVYLIDDIIRTELEADAALIESAKFSANMNLTNTDKLSDILAKTDEYFYILYGLLDSDVPEIVEKAWSLIVTLPTNQGLQDSILKITQSTSWDDIIPIAYPYKLFYSLKVISGILKNAQNFPGWLTNFLDSGGLTKLTKILVEPQLINLISTDKVSIAIESIELTISLIKKLTQKAFQVLGSMSYSEYLKKLEQQAGKSVEKQQAQSQSDQLVINNDVAKAIIDILEHYQIIDKLVFLLNNSKNSKFAEVVQKEALNLLASILCFNFNYYKTLYNNACFQEYLMDMLLNSDNIKAKELIRSTLSTLFDIFALATLPKDDSIIPPNVFCLNFILKPLFSPLLKSNNRETYYSFLGDLLFLYSSKHKIHINRPEI